VFNIPFSAPVDQILVGKFLPINVVLTHQLKDPRKSLMLSYGSSFSAATAELK